MPSKKWVDARHPGYETWKKSQERQRASFVARRQDLAEYIVPYVWEEEDGEGDSTAPEDLKRAKLGYGISLNESYLSEIFGHERAAEARWSWGLLADMDAEEAVSGDPPTDTVASSLWADATLENTSWRNFFLRKVLEWMLTSPGGLVVIDAPTGEPTNRREDDDFRPYLRFVPSRQVLDAGRGKTGFRWVKLLEKKDDRSWNDASGEFTKRIAVYALESSDGPGDEKRTVLRRFEMDGTPIPPDPQVPEEKIVGARGDEGSAPGIDLGTFVDREGHSTLPLVKATFGEHPDVSWWGSGLLTGLDDIVLDLFNTVTEMREGYRDEVFAPFVHVGPEPGSVRELLIEGSKFLALGDEEGVSLERLVADAKAVSSGLEQIRLAIEAWERSAKRKAAKAQEREMSGVALEAEFQLDLAPLLREIAGSLDDVESGAMWIAAQFSDRDADEDTLAGIGVDRNRDFDPENEASRITRLVGEAKKQFGRFPSAQALSESFMRFLEAADIVDLDQEIEVGEGDAAETITLREKVRTQVEEGFAQAQEARRNADQSAIPLGGGGALGGA